MIKISGLSIIAILFIFTTGHSQNEQKVPGIQRIHEVLSAVEQLYVDDVDENQLTETAIESMLKELDPHSAYIPASDVQRANQQIIGNFVGVGIRFQILNDTLMVVATIPGGPSERVGLLPGDKIIQVDTANIAGIGLKNHQVREKLLGDKGTKVEVYVRRRNNAKTLEFTITRDVIPVHSVDAAYMLNKTVGYIKLNAFSRSSHEEVRDALKKLKSEGMKSLIFDLQGNGGGLMQAAQDLADEFLSGDKLVVYSEGRVQQRRELNTQFKGQFEKGKLIILTDEYSASASEILSGAVQDWDRGLVVGRRTFGKGLVQRPITLQDGAQLRLTIARYYTPSGRFIQKPYDSEDDYQRDLLNRYEHGEFVNQDSIKLDDSLKYETLITKRPVYGGGGIMPDYFVPLDTTKMSDYYMSLIRGGHVNRFSLTYVNEHRKEMLAEYEKFQDFKANYQPSARFYDAFMAYVAKEDPELEFNEEEFQENKTELDLRFKALLAQNLWGYSEFYEIYNASNEILNRALEIIESEEYTKINLAK